MCKDRCLVCLPIPRWWHTRRPGAPCYQWGQRLLHVLFSHLDFLSEEQLFSTFAPFINFNITLKFFYYYFSRSELFMHILDANPQRLQKALLPAHHPLLTLSWVLVMQQKLFILMWPSLPNPFHPQFAPTFSSSLLHFIVCFCIQVFDLTGENLCVGMRKGPTLVLSDFPNTNPTQVILSPLIWDATLITCVHHISWSICVYLCRSHTVNTMASCQGDCPLFFYFKISRTMYISESAHLKHPVGILTGTALTLQMKFEEI